MKPHLYADLILHSISTQFINEGLNQGENTNISYRGPDATFGMWYIQVQLTSYLCFNFFIYSLPLTLSIFSSLLFLDHAS